MNASIFPRPAAFISAAITCGCLRRMVKQSWPRGMSSAKEEDDASLPFDAVDVASFNELARMVIEPAAADIGAAMGTGAGVGAGQVALRIRRRDRDESGDCPACQAETAAT